MNKYEKLIPLCTEYFDAIGVEVDEGVVKKNIVSHFSKGEFITETDLEIELLGIELTIAYIDSEDNLKNLEKVFASRGTEKKILAFAESVEYKIKLEKKLINNRYDTNDVRILMTGRLAPKNKWEISIASRVEAIYDEIKIPKSNTITENVKGAVYRAKLYDLVEIYDEIGDELFKKNVRLRVERDTIGVSKEIKDTIRNNPAEFWFLNNGITIVTNTTVGRLKRDSITLNLDAKRHFSVVNGAQTISAAHDYFFCSGEAKEQINKSKEAMVLLRVVSVEEESADNNIEEPLESMSERVSKALNRQKPIESEDLAYYSNFVKNVNRLYMKITNDNPRVDDRIFVVVRRGENDNYGYNEHEHSLTLIARAIRASGFHQNNKWEYQPWKAINTYNADILKMDKNELKHTDLFKTKAADEYSDFIKEYQYVNIAIYIYRKFSEMKGKIDLSKYKDKSKLEQMRESGTWYFVSFFFKYVAQNDTPRRLKGDCVENFDHYFSSESMGTAIRLFFEILDNCESSFRLRELRQENAFLTIQKACDAMIERLTDLREKANSLFINQTGENTWRHSKYNATLVEYDGKFILQKGSVMSTNIDQYCATAIKELRDKYINEIDEEGRIKVDIEFSGLGDAAKFVEAKRIRRPDQSWILNS